MASMYDDRTMLSRPFRVQWAGWESNTYRLQEAGWELSMNQDPCYGIDAVSVLLRHQQADIRAGGRITGIDRMDYHGNRYGRDELPPVNINWLTSQRVQLMEMDLNDLSAYQPIDAKPQVANMKDLEDYEIFATQLVRTQPIIVPERSVSELLAEIIQKQEPGRAEHYMKQAKELERAKWREGQSMPRERFHAQIISLDEARAA